MLDINWGNLLIMLKKKPRSLLFDVSYLGLNFIACYRFLWGFFLGLGTNEWMMLMEIYVTCVDKEKTTTVGKCCFVTLISFWWHLAPLFWEFFSFKRTRKQGPKDHPWESIEEKTRTKLPRPDQPYSMDCPQNTRNRRNTNTITITRQWQPSSPKHNRTNHLSTNQFGRPYSMLPWKLWHRSPRSLWPQNLLAFCCHIRY